VHAAGPLDVGALAVHRLDHHQDELMLMAELICDAFGHRSSSRVARCGYRRMPMDCARTWSLPGWRDTDVRAEGREALPAPRPSLANVVTAIAPAL